MAGYIGARASVVSSGAERKQTYAITTTTTSLTGLAYTPTKVHVYHNGIRLVDGTDYTATDGSTITLTNAAQNGDEVVVISYATFQTSDTVSAANGGTFAGNVSMNGTLDVTGATTLTGQLNTGSILPSTDNASDLGSTSKRFQDLHLSGGISFDEDPSLVTGSVTGKTLDDVESGLWTATIGGTGGDPTSVTYLAQSAMYTKVGDIVTVTGTIGFSTYTGGSGTLKIVGLPYAAANVAPNYTCGSCLLENVSLTSGYTYAVARTTASQTYLEVIETGSNVGWRGIQMSQYPSNSLGKYINFTVTYRAA
jgi:hypothetical protein